jgi:hypothetical protein
MPIEEEIQGRKRPGLIKETDGTLLYRMNDPGREVMVIEGKDPASMESMFRMFLKALEDVLQQHEEPMVNIAAFFDGKKWCLLIFPRRKHRPDIFFKEGEDRIVISPGVIDMGGLLITPVERDFERIDGALVESIYREVSLDKKLVETAVDAMGSS